MHFTSQFFYFHNSFDYNNIYIIVNLKHQYLKHHYYPNYYQSLTMTQNKYLKWLMIGSGAIAAIALLAYQIINSRQPPKNHHYHHTEQTERISTARTVYSEYYFDKQVIIEDILSRMGDKPSIEDIFISSPKLISDEYVKYTKQMRKRRRLIRKHNELMYINIIVTYYEEVKELIERSRQELCQGLGISFDSFQGLVQNYDLIDDMQKLHQKVDLVLNEYLIIATSINKNDLNASTLEKILQEQIKFMKTKMYDRLALKLQKQLNFQQSEVLKMIECLLNDIIYEKFGYERQCIQQRIKELGIKTDERDKWRLKMEAEIGQIDLDTSFQHDGLDLANTLEESGNSAIYGKM